MCRCECCEGVQLCRARDDAQTKTRRDATASEVGIWFAAAKTFLVRVSERLEAPPKKFMSSFTSVELLPLHHCNHVGRYRGAIYHRSATEAAGLGEWADSASDSIQLEWLTEEKTT